MTTLRKAAQAALRGGGMSEPVAWTLAREGGELVYAVSSREAAEAWAANTNYHAAPIYTTDAIREAVEAAHARMIADGWRQCAKGQRTTQFCGQLQKAVEAERARWFKEIELRMPAVGITRATLKDVCEAIKRGAA